MVNKPQFFYPQEGAKSSRTMTSVTVAVILSLSFHRWYHGRTDRNQAEERLQGAGQLGSYLIRESDRKPGSYVLSFFGRTGFNHFRYAIVQFL